MEKLSDEELQGKTAEFRARLERAKCWKSLIPELSPWYVRQVSASSDGVTSTFSYSAVWFLTNAASPNASGQGKTLTATPPAYPTSCP
ncbi:hypothetical protein ACNKHU_00635 [Shigella flexneri]